MRKTTQNIKIVLDSLEPGTYRVAQLAALLREKGAITWASSWTTAKYVMEKLPDWKWNGIKAKGQTAWVKEEPKPVFVAAPIMPPMPRPHICEPQEGSHKGPITHSLARIEGMVERLCVEWKIPVDNLVPPPGEAAMVAMIQVAGDRDRYKEALESVLVEVNAELSQKHTHYLRKSCLNVISFKIRQALSCPV